MLAKFIAAINTLNQPYIAIIVVILGCVFDVTCQKYGISNDAATGIIGAGIGLLTGQALHKGASPDPPTVPANPANNKEQK